MTDSRTADVIAACPFCKSLDVVARTNNRTWHWVDCDDCEATGPMEKTKQEAIERWNGVNKVLP